MAIPFRLIAAPHTPFNDRGELAVDIVPRQAAALAAGGCTGAFVAGSTGEWPSLRIRERRDLAKAWSVAGPAHDLEVFIHVGHLCHADAVELAGHAGGLEGVTALAALAPCYYRPQGIEGLWDWCAPIAAAGGGKPFFYYHIPAMTGVEADVAAFLRGGRERVPGLAGVKFTADSTTACAAAIAVEGMEVLFGGDERLVIGVRLGAAGAVGSSYNFAGPLYRAILDAEAAGETARADELQARAAGMIGVLNAEGYLPAAKALMTAGGVPVGAARPPFGPYSGELKVLETALRNLGLERGAGGWAPRE